MNIIVSFTYYLILHIIRFQFKQVQNCGDFSMTNLKFIVIIYAAIIILQFKKILYGFQVTLSIMLYKMSTSTYIPEIELITHYKK